MPDSHWEIMYCGKGHNICLTRLYIVESPQNCRDIEVLLLTKALMVMMIVTNNVESAEALGNQRLWFNVQWINNSLHKSRFVFLRSKNKQKVNGQEKCKKHLLKGEIRHETFRTTLKHYNRQRRNKRTMMDYI